jgi:hypothetical protein
MAEPGDLIQKDLACQIIEDDRTISVAYYGPDHLKKFEEDKANVEMRKPEELYHSIEIAMRVSASRIDGADPAKWLFIIQDGNKKEIYRSKGARGVPSIGDGIRGLGKTWVSYHYIMLTDEPVYPLHMRVVNPDGKPVDAIIEKK